MNDLIYKKKNFLLMVLLLLFSMTAHAKDQKGSAKDSSSNENRCWIDRPNIYAKIFGGTNLLQSTTISGNTANYRTGYIFAGSLGYCWRYGLHMEAEYAFRKNAISEMQFITGGASHQGRFETSSYMANLLWYLPLCSWGCSFWKVRPLLGAGIGYDFQQMHASNSRIVFYQRWREFSWQLMAGLAYSIFYNAELSLEYKFHQGGNFYNHAIGVGLAYKFFLK